MESQSLVAKAQKRSAAASVFLLAIGPSLSLDEFKGKSGAILRADCVLRIDDLSALLDDVVAPLVALGSFDGSQKGKQDLAWIAKKRVREGVLGLPIGLRSGRVSGQTVD